MSLGPAAVGTWHVSPDGEGDVATILDGVNLVFIKVSLPHTLRG